MEIQNRQHCQTLEPFRTIISILPDRFHVASHSILFLPSVSFIDSGTLFALPFYRFSEAFSSSVTHCLVDYCRWSPGYPHSVCPA